MNYLPRKDGELALWLNNYKAKITDEGAALGMTPNEITDEQTICDTMMTVLTALQSKRDELHASIKDRDEKMQTIMGKLRAGISHHKTAPGYNQAIGERLGIVSGGSLFDASTYKPTLKADIQGGAVRLRFTKSSTDGVNIYHRKKGEAEWKFLSRDTNSPYIYQIELAAANQPEHWEYKAFGILDDTEIGLPSDIVELVISS